MLTVTRSAAEQLREILEKKGHPDTSLRVYVAPGGCSGFQYGMVLDDKTEEGDAIVEQEGIKLIVDSFSAMYLAGAEIDYKDDLIGGGFTINNPNAVSSCACGQSFQTAEGGGHAQSCH